MTIRCLARLAVLLVMPPYSVAVGAELLVGKVCPVQFQQQSLGILVFSQPWYHSSRQGAAYIASDNATGVGLEIHLFASAQGTVVGRNLAVCDRYRLLQVRNTNTTARLFPGERALQVDVPPGADNPFYDTAPLEHGYGMHLTPEDDADKPWQGRQQRASTVAIYDTPYISDSYGVEGKDIQATFETCAVCQRQDDFDLVLACGEWGYMREYMGGMTGWAEPEFIGVSCRSQPSKSFRQALDSSHLIEYSFWEDWRPVFSWQSARDGHARY
ncbi:hypothetical protein ACFVYJ_12235 [Pontibacter sp. JAM-7]|uniref:hypothetical protein n=1 Tax=Pontibacter sp. JAM-7 TaxID=3366581 RepID=UPI003AF6AF94